jgi:hypothetical protein
MWRRTWPGQLEMRKQLRRRRNGQRRRRHGLSWKERRGLKQAGGDDGDLEVETAT